MRKTSQLRDAGSPGEFLLNVVETLALANFSVASLQVDLRKPFELRHAGGPREIFICLAGDQLIFRKPFELRHAGGPSDVFGCYFASRFEEAI